MNARRGVIALGITAQGRNELIAHREGRKAKAWVYIVQSKAAVRGVRLRPRGAVYTVEECRALLTVNPGVDELRTLHKAKTIFEGELSAGEVPP